MKPPLTLLSAISAGLALLLTVPAKVRSQEARLEWIPEKAMSKFGYYVPKRLSFATTASEGLKKSPEGLANPIYAELAIGPSDARQKFIVLIDDREDAEQRMWVDSNGNGDLTDDPPVIWTSSTSQQNGHANTMHKGSAKIQVNYDKEKKEMQLTMYRFDPKLRADAKNTVFFYREWGYSGEVVLGGKSYKAMLDDRDASGDFRGRSEGGAAGSGVNLLVDVKGTGRFSGRYESFDVRKPFQIDGSTYEIAGLTASGEGLKIIKSDKTVEKIVAQSPAEMPTPNRKAITFEAKTTSGQTVRFPDDYKGKAVLLDFWATWCGPCRAELPNIRRVYESLHAKGFEILAVSLDHEDALEKLAAFTKENSMPWPQICDGKGWEAALAQQYGVRGIPAAFLVNGTTGIITAEGRDLRGEGLQPAVETLLAALSGKSPPSAPVAAADSKPGPKAGERVAKPSQAPQPDLNPLVAKAEAALKAGKLLGDGPFLEQRKSPTPGVVELAAPSSATLRGREVAKLAQSGYLRVGWFYHCTKCGNWHVKTAGGYAIASDAIATAWHVMTPPDTLKEGYAIAVDNEDGIVPITGVIASDQKMDALVLRVARGNFHPLALSDAAEVGDTVYCFSDPLRQRGYFSAGIVNRIHSLNSSAPFDLSDPASVRMNVSTDWAPGSSGAAVLDASGNVVGHVATMSPLFEKTPTAASAAADESHSADRFHGASLITLHDAVPAKSILALLKRQRSAKGVAQE